MYLGNNKIDNPKKEIKQKYKKPAYNLSTATNSLADPIQMMQNDGAITTNSFFRRCDEEMWLNSQRNSKVPGLRYLNVRRVTKISYQSPGERLWLTATAPWEIHASCTNCYLLQL